MAKKKRKRMAAQAQTTRPTSASGGNTGFAAMRWDQKIVWVCLHLLLLLVPVALGNLTFLGIGGGMPISFDQFDIVKLFVMRATTIIALAAWGVGMLVHGGKLRRTKVDWVILAFLVWVLVSSFFSIHVPTAIFGKYRRFEGLVSFINYALVFFLIIQVADRGSRIRSLARTLVISSMFVTFYGLMQYVGRDVIQWGTLPFENTRSFSTYGNPDLLGGFLVLGLPVAVAMALSEGSKIWRVVYWTATLMLSMVMITAFTRGAWIGGFAGLCALGFAAWRAKVKSEPIDWAFAGVSVLAVVAVVIRSLTNPNVVLNFWTRLVSIFQFGSGSAASRFQIWQAALNAIKMQPIVGFGADTFRLVFPFVKTEAYVQQVGYLSVADNVHNYPLQLMAGIGIPGFLLMYGAIGVALYFGAPSAFTRNTGNKRLLQAGVWAAVFGYVIHLLFGLSVTGTTVLMWALMALALAPTSTSVEVPAVRSRMAAVAWAGSAGLIVGALVLSVMNIQYIVADKYYLLGRIGPYDSQTKVAYLNKAIELNPYNDMYRAEVGLQYQQAASQLIGQALQEQTEGSANSGQTLAAATEYLKKSEQAILDTIEFVPSEYDNYVFLANIYNTMASYADPSYRQKAIDIARRGTKVEHFGPAIRLQLARALAESGQSDEAIKELEFAVRVDPGYTEASALLASLLIDKGDTERARVLLDAILASRPDDMYAKTIYARLSETRTPVASETTAP